MTGHSDHIWDASLEDGDTLHEECGVFGIFNHADAGALSVLGLHSLQHRGQEAAGIVTYDNGHFTAERHVGLVGDIFGGRNSARAANLKGRFAIGHNRYSTAGGSRASNIQPIFADLAGGGLAIAHNGNLTNAHTLRTELVAQGAIFQSTSDTETIVHLTRAQYPSAHRGKAGGCAVPGGRRLFAGGANIEKTHRGARSQWRAPAGDGPAGRGHHLRVGNLCPGHHRRRLCARRQAGRDGGGGQGRHPQPLPLQAATAPLLRLRIHLFRPARFNARRA